METPKEGGNTDGNTMETPATETETLETPNCDACEKLAEIETLKDHKTKLMSKCDRLQIELSEVEARARIAPAPVDCTRCPETAHVAELELTKNTEIQIIRQNLTAKNIEIEGDLAAAKSSLGTERIERERIESALADVSNSLQVERSERERLQSIADALALEKEDVEASHRAWFLIACVLALILVISVVVRLI